MIDDQGYCLFPDSVTERGLKHLGELLELKRQGIRTVMLYVVQREDCHSFKLEQTIDPAYCKKLKEEQPINFNWSEHFGNDIKYRGIRVIRSLDVAPFEVIVTGISL